MTQEALKLALEALERNDYLGYQANQKAITAIKKALAEHAMRETQRLGQEIEQEPVPCCGKYETCTQACTPRGRFLGKREALAQPEQEPVAWPCLIDSADFSENTITLVMQCEDYKVSAGTHWLSTTPPKENT